MWYCPLLTELNAVLIKQKKKNIHLYLTTFPSSSHPAPFTSVHLPKLLAKRRAAFPKHAVRPPQRLASKPFLTMSLLCAGCTARRKLMPLGPGSTLEGCPRWWTGMRGGERVAWRRGVDKALLKKRGKEASGLQEELVDGRLVAQYWGE